MEFHLVQNRKENCHHDHNPFNVKGNGNIVFSVYSVHDTCHVCYSRKQGKTPALFCAVENKADVYKLITRQMSCTNWAAWTVMRCTLARLGDKSKTECVSIGMILSKPKVSPKSIIMLIRRDISFDFDNVKVLDLASHVKTRLHLESIHTKLQFNPIDRYCLTLNNAYDSILHST